MLNVDKIQCTYIFPLSYAIEMCKCQSQMHERKASVTNSCNKIQTLHEERMFPKLKLQIMTTAMVEKLHKKAHTY